MVALWTSRGWLKGRSGSPPLLSEQRLVLLLQAPLVHILTRGFVGTAIAGRRGAFIEDWKEDSATAHEGREGVRGDRVNDEGSWGVRRGVERPANVEGDNARSGIRLSMAYFGVYSNNDRVVV